MRAKEKKLTIPTLRFHSNCFKCSNPTCDYVSPPLLVKGDVAVTKCPKCGSFLVRIK